MGWWIAVPVGVALGLALVIGLDRGAAPAGAQRAGSGSGFTLSIDQIRINQRVAFSAAAGAPERTVLDLAGVKLRLSCDAGSAGETTLAISATADQETSVIGTANLDTGPDPANPNPPCAANFQTTLAAGQANPLGGPPRPTASTRGRSEASCSSRPPGRSA